MYRNLPIFYVQYIKGATKSLTAVIHINID